MNTDIRQRFAEIARQADDSIQLDEAALLVAAEAEANFSVDHYLDQLDQWAIRFRQDKRFSRSPDTMASGLVGYIHEDLGFNGNITDYYDPANSYLNRVIDCKRGIPISLALVHISIGSRSGIPVDGISFPGHFLVRYGKGNGVIVDPFSGRELSRADCENLLRQITSPKAKLMDKYFEPASPRDILIRMLDNLKQIFWRQQQWSESKACIDRQLLLLPGRAEYNVQLGAVYEMQGNMSLAQHTYTQVLHAARDDQLKQLASKRLLAMESSSRTIH